VVGTLLILPLRNYTNVLLANRLVKDSTLLLILQSVLLTASAFIAYGLRLGIVGYSLAYLLAFYLVAIIGWIRVFKVHLPSFWKPLTLDFPIGLELLKSGIFFALSSLTLILNSSFDNLILAKFYGPGAVVDYSFPVRLFGFTLVLSMLAGGSLSSAYTQALGQNKISWIRKRYRGSMIVGGFISTALCLLLVPFAGHVIRVWSVGTSQPNMLMIMSVAFWFVVTGFYQPTSFLMNGLYRAKDTLKVGIASVIINIPATLIGLKLFGPPGAPLGSATATLLAGVVWSHYLCERAIQEAEQNSFREDSVILPDLSRLL
jgi:O-antigen/teichoic acid export membrane protein